MLTRGLPCVQVTKCKFNSKLKQEKIFFDFSIASETQDFNMVSRERWHTTTEAMESIFLNSDSERDENSSNSDSESGGSEEAVASEKKIAYKIAKKKYK